MFKKEPLKDKVHLKVPQHVHSPYLFFYVGKEEALEPWKFDTPSPVRNWEVLQIGCVAVVILPSVDAMPILSLLLDLLSRIQNLKLLFKKSESFKFD